jgi:ABC-type sugar transport system permease subunit
MMNIDKQIREALDAEDREWFDSLGEPSLPMQVIESFKTQSKWIIGWAICGGLFMMAVGVFSGIKLYHAEEPRDLVHWAVVFAMSMLAVAAMKIWYWMELQKNVLVRELKRLEMQVARLSQKQNGE